MFERLPLFGADRAEALACALADVLAPVAGWVFAHHPHARSVELLLEPDGADFRVVARPAHPVAVEEACRAVFGHRQPRAERTSWRAAWRGFPGGVAAVATPSGRTKGNWALRAQTRALWTPEPEPEAPPDPPEDPDVRAFWEDLEAMDKVDALCAVLAILLKDLDGDARQNAALSQHIDALQRAIDAARR